MPSPAPRPSLHAADATQEYRGPIDEIVTDVSMELLPDASVAGQPVPATVRQAIVRAQSLAPLAIDPPAPSRGPSPDASLFEFPHPVSPELFTDADATGELAPTDLDDALRPRREPPKWRFAAFTLVMVAAGLLVGLAVGSRSRVSEPVGTETPAAAARPIERRRVDLPDPATVATAVATNTTAAKSTTVTTTATTTATAGTAAPATGTLLTPKWAKNRRVFVDGKEIGRSGKLEAACGVHTVKVGVVGRARKTTIPCGGEITVLP